MRSEGSPLSSLMATTLYRKALKKGGPIRPPFKDARPSIVEVGFLLQPRDKLIERHRTFIAFFSRSHGHRPGFGVLQTDPEQIRNFFNLSIANLGADLIVSDIEFNPQKLSRKLLVHFASVIRGFFGN